MFKQLSAWYVILRWSKTIAGTMGRLLPSDLTPLLLSLGETAELRTLDLLRRRLPPSYTVYHSVHWSLATSSSMMFGEADFIVVNLSGEAVVVEQKSGELQESSDGLSKVYNGSVPKLVLPQIQRTLAALRSQYARQTNGKTISLDYIFYCPNHLIKNPLGAGLALERIIDASKANGLIDLITRIIGPDADNMEGQRVHRFFESHFQLCPNVHAHVREGERAMARAAGGLSDVLLNIEMKPLRLRIRGTAGCGKSTVALRFAEAAHAQRKRTLVVCFNRPLAERLRAFAPANVFVQTFYGLLDRFLQSRGHRLDYERISDAGFWVDVQERVIAEEISAEWMFDALIVDEGQDFEAEWFDILQLFLKSGADVLWMEDPDQAIRRHSADRSELEVRLQAKRFIGYKTTSNHRSPQSIAAYILDRLPAFKFIPANALPGLGVCEHDVDQPSDQVRRVGALIADLRQKGFSNGDIVVLSMRGLGAATLNQAAKVGSFTLRRPTGGYDLLGNQLHSDGQIRFDTIYRFKGQEAPAIILTDVPNVQEQGEDRKQSDRLFYAATTRATVRLEVIYSDAMTRV